MPFAASIHSQLLTANVVNGLILPGLFHCSINKQTNQPVKQGMTAIHGHAGRELDSIYARMCAYFPNKYSLRFVSYITRFDIYVLSCTRNSFCFMIICSYDHVQQILSYRMDFWTKKRKKNLKIYNPTRSEAGWLATRERTNSMNVGDKSLVSGLSQ